MFAACQNSDSDIRRFSGKVEQVEEAREVRSLFSQTGRLKAILKAPLMLRHLGDSVVIEFPRTMHVDFYDSLNKIESFLDARYARYVENRALVLLRDSVRVINRKGDTLKTQELWWDQNARKFYTDSMVHIVQKDKRINGGKGLEAGQDMTWYLIKQPVGTVLVGGDVLPQ
ncbi:LPS export ABC transporter periplasmic protein LptC [Flaviaesturariibacter aridisoli]|uniref:LPS export ABC transporter periplasmic protein LptC n=1 Tax=Flaviaesturariibacter aridisoli TaxID=2545761 RepID=A0A4R4E0T8_9BACT|nr:LPS export ABC transporter periplasmic protein LptC [Flaviaesturariibacter aridisoli]TCZ67897.1 LPS export ABC transporter periplasmic protein LptC [Flaviaesturariibacter aridisoli]